jgi:hypothetical protein
MITKQFCFLAILSSFLVLVACTLPIETSNSSLSYISSPANLAGSPKATSLESYNWAGYAIDSTLGSVTSVRGSWKQPSVTCPSTGDFVAAFWVGIDGLVSPTVEQTGTVAECVNGVASYLAWYEFYPAASITITSVPVKPGNTISATVKYSTTAKKFTATIKDVTTGKTFSITAAVSGAERSSAEWIEEAPTSCASLACLYAMPDFGTASYGKDLTSVAATNEATISGSTKTILGFGSILDSLAMVSYPSGAPLMAQPSALSTDGTSFTITWVSSGP